MAKKLMILGTCSNAGKSLIAAGLCRILKQDGHKVAPFKAQNMALNSYITEDGLEMGRAQVVQAEAAGVKPDVRMNPVLLKPNSDTGSQVIIKGEVLGNFNATAYYEKKDLALEAVLSSLESLEKEYDYIIMEGAGSASEVNLKDKDIVNMGLAKEIGAPAIVVGDIDRGGVFAALAGTMMLFDERERELVKGVLINKFRGNLDILKPGLTILEDIIKRPVLGVVPYMKVDIDDEDSLSEKMRVGKGKGLVDIAVIRLPRISNFTDFNPLEYMDCVSLRYVESVRELGEPDMIILPGTKNTMGDLKWLRETGLETRVQKHASAGKPVFGICGGYQMLGQTLSDPHKVEYGGDMNGIGLLPHKTVFDMDKTRNSKSGVLASVDGIFSDLSGKKYQGYEIHMGISLGFGNIINRGNVYGTYIHGIFDKGDISSTIINSILKMKGIDTKEMFLPDMDDYKESQYEILANGIRNSVNIDIIYEILGG